MGHLHLALFQRGTPDLLPPGAASCAGSAAGSSGCGAQPGLCCPQQALKRTATSAAPGPAPAPQRRSHPAAGKQNTSEVYSRTPGDTGSPRSFLCPQSSFHPPHCVTPVSAKVFGICFFKLLLEDTRITILMLTMALLKAAGQKWGARGRKKA